MTLEYAEYKEAIRVVEAYRNEIQVAHKNGERIICRSFYTGRFIEVTDFHYWRWGINDYLLGDVIPLTDEDAAVWPRLKIMVRDESGRPWHGPFDFLGVDINDQFVCPSGHWNFARRCTDKETSQPDGRIE